MGLPRKSLQTVGWSADQAHDADFMGVAYDHASRPINYAGRYTIVVDDDGIPVRRQVADTPGPRGQWICWPGVGGDGRVLAQWGQVFTVKITTADPLKATPIKLADGTLDDTLGELAVTTVDGSTPIVDDIGIVVAGSSLGSQEPIFFAGSGGGMVAFQIQSGANPYVAYEWDEAASNVKVGGIHTNNAIETNNSVVISSNTVVYCKRGSDGKYYFSLPMTDCS